MYLNIFFIISGFILAFLIVFRKLFVSRVKNNMILSHYVASIALFLLLYIVGALLLTVFGHGIKFKVIMLLFGISPFIIGKLATYEKESLYSLIQVILIILSIVFVYMY